MRSIAARLQARPGGQIVLQLRSEEKDEHRDQQTPRDYAAGEVQRREFRADNVSDSDQRGTYAGRRASGDASGSQYLVGAGAAEGAIDASNIMKKSWSGANRLKAPPRKVAAPKPML